MDIPHVHVEEDGTDVAGPALACPRVRSDGPSLPLVWRWQRWLLWTTSLVWSKSLQGSTRSANHLKYRSCPLAFTNTCFYFQKSYGTNITYTEIVQGNKSKSQGVNLTIQTATQIYITNWNLFDLTSCCFLLQTRLYIGLPHILQQVARKSFNYSLLCHTMLHYINLGRRQLKRD
jgi:hypothetical protein